MLDVLRFDVSCTMDVGYERCYCTDSEETKWNGLVLIVDARRGSWRVARSCIRLSMVLLGSSATSVIVVRPEGFWDKRVDSCTKSHKEGEVGI